MTHPRRTVIVAAAVILAFAGASPAQVRRLAEMNTKQIRSLDRAKTAVLIPGGILEEHGPYLPCFNDGYWNEWFARRLAEAIVARPGWTALVFPTIPSERAGPTRSDAAMHSPAPMPSALRPSEPCSWTS
jgi:hypothetical protein